VGSASSELCTAREDLRTSITDLSNVSIVSNGTQGVRDAITKIRTNLAAVRSAAGSDLQPQIDAFQTSLDSLQSALDQSGTPPVASIVSGVRDVATTGATLLTSLNNLKCP
jgi:capsule polysaccharide export protein KpsE/RkpR